MNRMISITLINIPKPNNMPKRILCLIAILAIFVFSSTNAQTNKTVTEYLSVPGPIVLNQNSFNLAWSSHPSANYYKQEYIPVKDNVEKLR